MKIDREKERKWAKHKFACLIRYMRSNPKAKNNILKKYKAAKGQKYIDYIMGEINSGRH